MHQGEHHWEDGKYGPFRRKLSCTDTETRIEVVVLLDAVINSDKKMTKWWLCRP
jgi:hypothetical protein